MDTICKTRNRLLNLLSLGNFAVVFGLAFLSVKIDATGQNNRGLEFTAALGVDRDISQFFGQIPELSIDEGRVYDVTSILPRHFMFRYYRNHNKLRFNFGLGILSRSMQIIKERFGSKERRQYTQLTLSAGMHYNRKVNETIDWQIGVELMGAYRQNDRVIDAGSGGSNFSFPDLANIRARANEYKFGTGHRSILPMFHVGGQIGIRPFDTETRIILGISLYGQFSLGYAFSYSQHLWENGSYSSISAKGPDFSMWFPALVLGFEI